MNIAILGTGIVGTTIGSKLIELGHHVKMGSRSAGNEKAVAWVEKNNTAASEGTFEDAAKFAEVIVLCLNGAGALDAIRMAGAENFPGKTVIDITNPLDFSKGMPPSLFVPNTDSLGEQLQAALPDANVVKTLNIVTAALMVDPAMLPSEVDMLIAGNSTAAKETTRKLLESFGWKTVIDLGGIQAARLMEHYVLLWVNLWQSFGDPYFGIKFVRK